MPINPAEFDPEEWDNMSVDDVIGPPSVTVEHIQNEDFPVHYEPRCYVCTSRWRFAIEYYYIGGMKPKAILEKLAEKDEQGLKAINLYRHFQRGHLQGHKQLIFQKMWDKATEAGLAPHEYEESLEDEFAALQITVGKFRQQLGDPNQKVSVAEGLAAVKLLHDFKEGEKDTGVTQSDLYVMVNAFMEATQAVLNKHAPSAMGDAMTDLGILLDRNPDLAKLVAKTSTAKPRFTTDIVDDDDEILVAELVEGDGENVHLLTPDEFPSGGPHVTNSINERDEE